MVHKVEFSRDATENNIIRMMNLLAPHAEIVRMDHNPVSETWDVQLKSGKVISDITYECAVDEERLRGDLEAALQSLELL